MALQEQRPVGANQSPTGSFNGGGKASGSTQAAQSSSSSSRVRRRNRMIQSCLNCRRRKLKCDKSHPCINCTKGHRDCVFLAPALNQASQLRLTEIKEKTSSLELELERDVALASGSPMALGLPAPTKRASQFRDEEADPIPTPLASLDAAYDDDAEDNDVLDLGIKIGRMRITERVGGFFRPKIAEELDALSLPPVPSSDSTSNPSGPCIPTFLMPGPAYIAPTAGFFFGQTSHVSGLRDKLPQRQVADVLIGAYFLAVHPVAKILHKQSFEAAYESFWDEINRTLEPPASVQAVVFAAMFSGLISMDDEDIINMWGVHKDGFVETIRLGTESALCRANFLRTTKVETLQAFVMFLIPLCRVELSRTHSVLVGSAIRLAECMGLHRDGMIYGLTPLETHVRRMIWYQLCLLDIRTCEAQGPRPGIRKDEFDTLIPCNVDDIDVRPDEESLIDRERWTDTTLVRMRFEINEFMRFLWSETRQIREKQSSLTSSLVKMEAFQREINEKYDSLFDDRIPIQKHAKLLKSLLLCRLPVLLLAPYHTAPSTMSAKLRHVVVCNAVTVLESSILIETLPELHPWAFWSGAYHQNHAAFLLLIDITLFKHGEPIPVDPMSIWRCLDYVFETDPAEPTDVKAEKILNELKTRTKEYQRRRKMRAPTSMVRHVEDNLCRRDEPKNQAGFFDGRESFASEVPGAIGKAPIPNDCLESSTTGRMFPVISQHQYGPRVGGASIGVAPLASQLPEPNGGDFAMPDIDWDIFDELYAVHHDFGATPSGFTSVNEGTE